MASEAAVGVTVVGVVAIVGLLGLLGRYLGLWTWAWAWIQATKEEKVQLCRSERTTSGRSYLLENDLDWIGLWPRTGSYKRFTNLDDLSLVPAVDESQAINQPDLPPQPLRPAPAPPPRIGGWTDSEQGTPSPASSVGGLGSTVETPPEPSRPAPILDRRDSNRSLTGRIQRRDSSKELLGPSQQGSPKRGSTNPFRASWVPPDESSEVTLTQETSVETYSQRTNYIVENSSPFPSAESSSRFERERHLNGPVPSADSFRETQDTPDLLGHDPVPNPNYDSEKSEERFVEHNNQPEVVDSENIQQTAGEKMFPSNKTFVGGGTYPEPVMEKISEDSSLDNKNNTSNLSAGQRLFGGNTGISDLTYGDEETKTDVEVENTKVSADSSIWSSGPKAVELSSSSNEQTIVAVSTENTLLESTITQTDVHETSTNRNSYDSQFSSKVYDNSNAQTSDTDDNKYNIRNFNSNPPADHNYEVKNLINMSQSNVNDIQITKDTSGKDNSNSVTSSTVANDDNYPQDTKPLSTGNTISQHTNTTVVSMTPPSGKDAPASPDLLGSFDVPETPPNTATHVLPVSPRTPSRLAEVEARVRLLGERQEPTRDTSQDWWPTERSSSSSSYRSSLGDQLSSSQTGEMGLKVSKSSLSGSGILSRDKGLSSVDEESDNVFESERTQVNSESSEGRRLLGGEGSSDQVPALAEEEESEEDASTRRVREYIASLSARLRQLPDESSLSNNSDFLSTPPTSATFPSTPPNSARILSESVVDTPPLSAASHNSPFNQARVPSSTPPSSANYRQMYSSRRASADASPSPISPGVFNLNISRRLSLDTPPNSANMVTATPPNSASSQVMFGETPPSSAGFSNTPPSSAGFGGSFDSALSGISGHTLKRAVSCDSVSSDTSVTLGELEDTSGQVTGFLSIQLIYDSDTADLEVLVVEGKDLVGPDPHVAVDSYVRVFLLPDKSTNMQTRVFRRANNPAYRERFLFALEEEELTHRSLAFYMYASDKFTNTLIGEAHLKLTDVDLTGTISTTLPLTDMGQKGVGYGEIMFSLSYLPTAERLTVVIVKARSLHFNDDKPSADPFVKVYVLQNGKKVMKKKTSIKKDTKSPVFNEAMIFSVPAPALHNIQLRVTVAEHGGDGGQAKAIGHVIVGTQAQGKALSHWNQMMSALRKPIGMWHPIRR